MLARGTCACQSWVASSHQKRPVIETEFSFDWVVVADCNRNGTLTVTRKPNAEDSASSMDIDTFTHDSWGQVQQPPTPRRVLFTTDCHTPFVGRFTYPPQVDRDASPHDEHHWWIGRCDIGRGSYRRAALCEWSSPIPRKTNYDLSSRPLKRPRHWVL